MFIPNTTCKVRRLVGANLYGMQQFGRPQTIRCAIVTLIQSEETTSVRTDSSASHSAAHEAITKARMLFPKTFTPKAGDLVEFMDFRMRISGVFPRYNVPGKLDHWQVDLITTEKADGAQA